MSNRLAGHPDDGLLMRLLDGELSARKARQVRRHLEACWQCRAELESLEATVGECMRYRSEFLGAHLPEAPAPWMDLSRGFERLDAEAAAEPFWKRLTFASKPWQWSAAAVAAAVLLAVFLSPRMTPSVQAAVLLRKAVAAANTQPAHVRHVLIRTRAAQVTRTVGVRRAALAPLPPALDALLVAARYDADDPLSAHAFQTWHDSLPEKTDSVSAVPDPLDAALECSRIQTAPASGQVASASITFRNSDLEPIAARLDFRDRDWIEFSEVPEPSTRNDGSLAANPVDTPMRPAVPSRPAAVTPGETAPISAELQVLSALHQIGADLGDPIEVKRVEGRVLVSGLDIAPRRQHEIEQALNGLPDVAVEFSRGTSAPIRESAPAATVSGAAPDTRLENRLERQLGGRAELDRFTSRMLEENESAMAHAYALRSLAERFLATDEAALAAHDRDLLHSMAREHLANLATEAGVMETVLQPVLVGMGGALPSETRAKVAVAAWQSAVPDLFAASRRVEVLLSTLLGVTPADPTASDIPSQLLAALRDLRTDLDRCQRTLAQ